MSKTVALYEYAENGSIVRQRQRGAGERQPYGAPAFAEQNRVTLDLTYLLEAPGDPHPVTRAELDAMVPEVLAVHRALTEGRGNFRDGDVPMLGWLHLPERLSAEHLEHIQSVAADLSSRIDAYVSLGIGGSYLGVEATVQALSHTHFNRLSREERGNAPEIHFLGQNMDPDHFRDTLDLLRGKRVGINVISKSGTTTETALAFRVLRRLLENIHGDQARDFILVTTDAKKGALRLLAEQKKYATFEVPDDIGGRFSILSDVGLVGIALAGIDIGEFVAGFAVMKQRTDVDDFWANPALVHAAARTLCHRKGKKVEVVATNSTALYHVARFMEQLFPESEGHDGHGMWVSPALYSEKLHANGQMVQQGERNILETFLRLEEHNSSVSIPVDPQDLDGFNFLPAAGHDLAYINQLVVDGPAYAHYLGGTPNMTLNVPRRNAYCLGQLYFLLERSVAVSGALLGHNPFVQPGVVAYKNAIFALAGKPGHEMEGQAIRDALAAKPRLVVG
ncbi:MAG: glucose-6-phosphate isomerase [Deltaproteobacteria bacterium]|nr:glucose-6-phosphate isomerase [Deltaproteobacteria bacterium]